MPEGKAAVPAGSALAPGGRTDAPSGAAEGSGGSAGEPSPAAGEPGAPSPPQARERGFWRIMLWASVLGVALPAAMLASSLYLFVTGQRFGALPEGDRLRRAEASPLYRDGAFRNPGPRTEPGGAGERLARLARAYGPGSRKAPAEALPARATDLGALPEGSLVWLGHSAFVLRLGGVTLLADPAGASGSALPWLVRSFRGTGIYPAEALPAIDLLLVSHDHPDHLDLAAALALRDRTGAALCGLGTGAHLERWGYAPGRILEGEWWDSFAVGGLTVTLVPALHGSGRGVRRDQALWTGFAIEGGGRRVFYGGDSGYGPHFGEIGRRLGPFDIGMVGVGQYDFAWPEAMMTPEQGFRAALELRLRRLVPVHLGRFGMAAHPWDEPLERAFAAARAERRLRLVTPLIGETVMLEDETALYMPWWRGIP
ncbi:MAG: MBL fold metallo-hydrolase [Deltaproteobacteria bacterium]|nr:MBL fold metallo-hydrolase [Deltaproteobacteria bacterium]